MIFRLMILDTIRRTPSKLLILFFSYIIIGHVSPRFKISKELKTFSFKEVENRRRYAFLKALQVNIK